MSDSPEQPENQPAQAVSLEYDGESPPTLTASAEGDLADEIIRIAQEHDVPIYENQSLVDLLRRMELGDEIPKELYLIIAQLIAFVYHLKGKVP